MPESSPTTRDRQFLSLALNLDESPTMIDIDSKPEVREDLVQRYAPAICRGLIAFLWTASLLLVIACLHLGIPAKSLPSLGDMATLLFGASSIALIIFSLLIGGIAIAGYQTLREGVKKDIEAATQQRFQNLEKELRGRVISAIGLITGTLYSKPEKLVQDPSDREYLSEAVHYCSEAYKLLKDVGGNAQFMALNNLAYYSCLHTSGDKPDPLLRDDILKMARKLREVGQEKHYPEALLTYCRAILQFSSDYTEVDEAHSIAESLLGKELTSRQRKEVTFYVTSLKSKLQKPGNKKT